MSRPLALVAAVLVGCASPDVVHSPEDLASVSNKRSVDGDLQIQAVDAEEISFGRLMVVHGSLEIWLAPSTRRVDLGSLIFVEGDLVIRAGLETSLETIEAPSLLVIGGSWGLKGLDHTEAHFENLQQVRGCFAAGQWSRGSTLTAPALTRIGQRIDLQELDRSDISFTALTESAALVGATVENSRVHLPSLVRMHPEPPDPPSFSRPSQVCSFPGSTGGSGSIALYGFTLSQLDLPSVQTAEADIFIQGRGSDVSLPALEHVDVLGIGRDSPGVFPGRQMSPEETLVPTHVDLSSLREVGEIHIDAPGATVLGALERAERGVSFEVKQVDLSRLTAAASVWLRTDEPVRLSLSKLDELAVARAPRLEMPELTEVGSLVTNEVPEASLPKLASAMSVSMHSGSRLELPVLAEVGALRLYQVEIDHLDLPALVSAHSVSISMSTLREVSLPRLEVLGHANDCHKGSLDLWDIEGLSSFGMPALQSVHGAIGFGGIGSLAACSLLESLRQVQGPLCELTNVRGPIECP